MDFTLHGVPLEFRWMVNPVECGLNDGVLSAVAGPTTDIFVHPLGTTAVTNAPRALATPPEGDWQLSARVRVDFRDSFDAGVLLVWADETHWAKLCFERSPAGVPMVVSVVCREVADDANAWTVTDEYVWLRISRVGGAYAFHASLDGTQWEFVRHFALPQSSVGFVVQAPVGAGCTAVFDHVSFVTGAPADLRDGS
jgi:regulation of enolase protein 1 (concanavalin A-like superfamily)